MNAMLKKYWNLITMNFYRYFLKPLVLISSFLLLLFLQIALDQGGYNYISAYILVLGTLYFKDIRSLSAGVFKLEKYEKLSKHIDNSIITMYKSNLIALISYRHPYTTAKIHKFDDFCKIVDDIRNMPENIKLALNDTVKEIANKGAQYQEKILKFYGEHNYYDINKSVTLTLPHKVIITEDARSQFVNNGITDKHMDDAIKAYK